MIAKSKRRSLKTVAVVVVMAPSERIGVWRTLSLSFGFLGANFNPNPLAFTLVSLKSYLTLQKINKIFDAFFEKLVTFLCINHPFVDSPSKSRSLWLRFCLDLRGFVRGVWRGC